MGLRVKWVMKKKYELINIAKHIFKSNNFYVYELINPNTLLPFYVGKGRDNRAWRHISLRNNKKLQRSNPHKFNTINKIINGGRNVIVKIISTHMTEIQAFKKEQLLIKKYGRIVDRSGLLTNLLKGGEGYTQDGKPVNQFTMWGEYIKTYKNAKEATRVNGWKNYSTICGCCKGREKSYKGFLWAHVGQHPKILTKAKPVYQWTLDGKFVKVYRNVSTAARELKCDSSTIGDCVVGYNRLAVGFLWTYDKKPPLLRKKKNTKPVKHINTAKLYLSVTEAAIATGHNIGDISACCNGRKSKIGKDKFCYI